MFFEVVKGTQLCCTQPRGDSYIMEGMDMRQGLSNPYPLQTKISAKIWTLRRRMAENFRPKRQKMNF